MKNLIIATVVGVIIVALVLLTGAAYVVDNMIKDAGFRNAAYVVVGFVALLTIRLVPYTLVLVVPFGVLWLIFKWWWAPPFLFAVVATAVLETESVGPGRYLLYLFFGFCAGYPMLQPTTPEAWRFLIAVFSGMFLGYYLDSDSLRDS